jgi:hypothetical protein
MQKSMIVTLVPLVCLTVTASAARLFNSARHDVATPGQAVVTTHRVTDKATCQEIEETLNQIAQGYRNEGFDSLESQTTPDVWKHWQVDVAGQYVRQRMDTLVGWPAFTVQVPQTRRSGNTEVMLLCGEERLKAWMVCKEGGWKLIGLVAPPTP